MFRTGQEVECIKDITAEHAPWMSEILNGLRLPKAGEKFTVRWCGERREDKGVVGLALNEILMPKHGASGVEIFFAVSFFRAILKTDISVLLKLCNPVPAKELELV